MLTLFGRPTTHPCGGISRRDFLKIGTLGSSGFSLADLLRSRAAAETSSPTAEDTSVIWLWLGGGPSHIETFDPKMTAPAEYRSVVGEVATSLPGVMIGGLFPQMAALAKHMTFVRSFAHENSGHVGGTHYVMTGYDYPPADQGQPAIKPGLGSITARYRGPNHRHTGLPTYVRIKGIYGDGSAWLGAANNPFDLSGDSRDNLMLRIGLDRVSDRRSLLQGLDRINREIEHSDLMTGLDEFELQAFDMLLGRSKEAFDLDREDPRLKAKYGTGLGEQLLLARRLCEAGAGFVTLNYGKWDMHDRIEMRCKSQCPQVDQAVAALVDDVAQRGLSKRILLVITGEFGRTPRINGNAGRDHWAPLSTLAFAHGNFRQGQVIGESSSKVEVPKTNPITPQDLMATVFQHLNIDHRVQYLDQAGRPTSMITAGQPIRELL